MSVKSSSAIVRQRRIAIAGAVISISSLLIIYALTVFYEQRAEDRIAHAIIEAGGHTERKYCGPRWALYAPSICTNMYYRIYIVDMRNSVTTEELLTNVSSLKNVVALQLDETRVDDKQVSLLKGLASLRLLTLSNTQVTDSGLIYFREMDSLETLTLSDTPVSDAGVESLSHLHNLRFLALSGTRVGDLGVASLTTLSRLQQLHLQSCAITDKAIPFLATLSSLQVVDLTDSNTTPRGRTALRAVLANCDVWPRP